MSITETVEHFIACVPWGPNRVVLVYHRTHGGRSYVRFRTWNQHKERHFWYPTKRFFVVPLGSAGVLSDAIRAAITKQPMDAEPPWLLARKGQDAELTKLHRTLGIPLRLLEAERRRMSRPPASKRRVSMRPHRDS